MSTAPENDPRVYFAQERTFLAWIRTGLGLMGVGFAVARFGLFLREMGARPDTAASLHHAAPQTTGLSVISGVALVGIGVLITVNAAVRHVLVTRALREGKWVPGQVSKSALALAGLLTAIGLGMAGYLLHMH